MESKRNNYQAVAGFLRLTAMFVAGVMVGRGGRLDAAGMNLTGVFFVLLFAAIYLYRK